MGVKVLKNSRIAIGEGKLTKLNGSRLRVFLVFEGGFLDVIGWGKWDFLETSRSENLRFPAYSIEWEKEQILVCQGEF